MANDSAASAQQESSTTQRSNSFSAQSDKSSASQTAAEFIRDQEALEADAREALPYSINTCTKILGPLRQNVFACLTCSPPPASAAQQWTPAGVCYACSVQCHGEHTLVEIFQKRNFTCDCGTSRLPSTSPCTLRTNSETNTKGDVHGEEPDANNRYNQNFKNRFCGCECDYDPFEQKGTMFQCMGLGSVETGGCGEDWYHPGCLVGMGPRWFEVMKPERPTAPQAGDTLATIAEHNEQPPESQPAENDAAVADEDDEPPMPPGFPGEDDFEGFICYKCVESQPWIKPYAGTPGFLPAVMLNHNEDTASANTTSKKRKTEDAVEHQSDAKRVKTEEEQDGEQAEQETPMAADSEPGAALPSDCKLPNLSIPPSGRFSLFFKEDFRDEFCRCSSCYKHLDSNPQLMEEEETYEPPLSEDAASQHGGSTHGSGSLLERGESALRNVDRVRAIEGVMAYNHLKEQLKPFFQQFAESGQAIGAEDIKAYFAKLRGDEEDIKEAGEAAASDGRDSQRREQGGH
ncbi:putative metaphase-anaphase transition protein [Emericellopsis atlantica]|uniref:Metaphase-anaphase transition protein n=1 Tax=Emericellopsis atlantica TaxID=2614577 RepID=A0A9P7ZNQ3_9HYPO|nr:putative metaphase-anaphase transition protein [Emericellopsis atlantica]KAG9255488.1 putative metaphase-anaphase transition protein [Emericellopsis atlantica]